MKSSVWDGLEYGCATGRQKTWARRKLIMNALYETNDEQAEYLKIKDIGKMPVPDESTDDFYIYKYSYQHIAPQTILDIYINKKDGRITIKRGNIGFGWVEVENAVYHFIENEIKKKNVYLQTNLNDNELIIK